MTATPPDFVAIGHIAKDIVPGGYAVGGTVSYASVTARNLGKRAGIVTCVEETFPVGEVLRGIEIVRAGTTVTTTFQNIYHEGRRTQFIRAVAEEITPGDIPPTWRQAPIILIGPIAQEVDEAVLDLFEDSLIGVTPQGWMRRWDESGRVYQVPWEGAERVLPRVHVLVFSEEDIGGEIEVALEYARLTEIVVLTRAERGATVFYRGEKKDFPARPAAEVDPTGAGDVFAAAFLIRYHETKDPWQAARFANVVASFSIEKPGLEGIPTRRVVEKWMEEHGWL